MHEAISFLIKSFRKKKDEITTMIARLPNIINFSQIFLEGNRMGSTLAAKLPAMSNATKLSTHKVHQFIKQCWEASQYMHTKPI